MEPSGRLSESVSSGRLAVAMPSAAMDAAEPGEVWIQLEQKLRTLAASEHARQCLRSSLGRVQKEALGEAAQLFVRRIVEILQQATEQLPGPDQQAFLRAAICRLFVLDQWHDSRRGS